MLRNVHEGLKLFLDGCKSSVFSFVAKQKRTAAFEVLKCKKKVATENENPKITIYCIALELQRERKCVYGKSFSVIRLYVIILIYAKRSFILKNDK